MNLTNFFCKVSCTGCLVLFTFISVAFGQSPDYPNSVFLYATQDCTGIAGDYLQFNVGSQNDYLPGLNYKNTSGTWNDRIRCLRIGANAKLIAYENTNFGGRVGVFTWPGGSFYKNDPRWPSWWDKKISSIKVVAHTFPGNTEVWLYATRDCTGSIGDYIILKAVTETNLNYKYKNTTETWNDKTRCIAVGQNVKLIGYQHSGYQGASKTWQDGTYGLDGDWWDKSLSSVKVHYGP